MVVGISVFVLGAVSVVMVLRALEVNVQYGEGIEDVSQRSERDDQGHRTESHAPWRHGRILAGVSSNVKVAAPLLRLRVGKWSMLLPSMSRLHPLLEIGSSSWSNADWPFYPKGMKSGDYLAHYATRFNIVEVDSSFYHAPSRNMCERWHRVVPDDFRFALKVPRSVTHDKTLAPDQDWTGFLSAVEPLGSKLSHLLLQFPYFSRASIYPDFESFRSALDVFLSTAAAPCPLVVEIRNKAWVNGELLALLRERQTIFALTVQEWMPTPLQLWEKHGESLVTGSSAYIRLLGERKRIDAITTTWDRLVIDRTPETHDVISVVRKLLEKQVPVQILINNHFGGYAVASSELLEKLWNEGSGLPS